MRIPEDIKKYLKTKYLNIGIKWLLATLIVATLVVFCNESFHYIPTGAKVVIYTIILLIPAFVFKIPKLIFDKSWEGTILSANCQEVMESDHKAIPKLPTLHKEISVHLEVLLPNEKIEIIDVRLGMYNDETIGLLDRYKEGNKILHVRGTEHYQVITDKDYNCVMCGHVINKIKKACPKCGHSLDLE